MFSAKVTLKFQDSMTGVTGGLRCKLAGVNVEAWLTYFLDHVHEYDNDDSLDIADFLPSSLVSKGLLKTSENLR